MYIYTNVPRQHQALCSHIPMEVLEKGHKYFINQETFEAQD